MRLLSAIFVAAIPILAGCSQNKMSERDLARQEKQALMEQKKQELLTVAGAYEGELTSEDGITRNVTLRLEVKEIPEDPDDNDGGEPGSGGVDPVLVPKLIGNLRFILGTGHEYEDAPISKADYSVQTGTVYLVARYKDADLIIQAKYQDGAVSGTWTFPAYGVSGNAELKKEGT